MMRQHSGFTLLEVMVVLAIIGGLLAVVSLSGSNRQAEDETLRFARMLTTQFAAYQQEASFQNLDLGLGWQGDAFVLLSLQDINRQEISANKSREELDALSKNPWQAYSGSLKADIAIPEFLLFKLSVDGQELDLNDHLAKGKEGSKPVLVFLSSDEYSPFRLELEHQDDPSFSLLLQGDGFNPPSLNVEHYQDD